MEGVVGSTTQAPPTTQIPWTTLGIVATPNNMVLLIRLVKSMGEWVVNCIWENIMMR